MPDISNTETIVAFHILKEGGRWQGFGSDSQGIVRKLTVETFESAAAAAKAIMLPLARCIWRLRRQLAVNGQVTGSGQRNRINIIGEN